MNPPPENELHRPVTDWPLLLAGPIVRRVTEDSVSVWVALRERESVNLVVFTEPGPAGQEMSRSVPSHARVVSIGQRLHLCVATAFGEFRPGHIYGYDLEIGTSTLGGLGLLSGPVPLGYAQGRRPGFLLPPSRQDLKLVQASCRKPHGCHPTLNDPDALPLVDRLIQDNRDDPVNRPHQLVLTGDQIYADDVPAAMLKALTSLGRELLDWAHPEVFPDRRNIETLTDDHVRLDPGKRSIFLDDQAVKDRAADASDQNRTPEEIAELEDLEEDEPIPGGNWEDYAANHLLFLGEWCAMYLMAWSPELWLTRDAVDPGDRIANPNRSTYYLPRPHKIWEHSPDTTKPALIYAENIPFVRRALANVATYMILDDHDVTDDWFLNGKVDEMLRRGRLTDGQPSSGGRRLMRNALIAYTLFQHWGNVPGNFDLGTPEGELLDLVELVDWGVLSGSPGEESPPIALEGREDDLDVVLDIGEQPIGADRVDERIRWDYEILFPEHRLIVLDTRTWRAFPESLVIVSVQDVVAAAEQRLAQPAGFGTTQLHGLAIGWTTTAQSASANGQPVLGDLLAAGAAMIENVASLADTVYLGIPGWPSLADAVIDHASALLVALGATNAVQDSDWAQDALDVAEATIALEWSVGAGVDPKAETLRAAASLEAGAVVLQAGVPGVAGRFAVAGIDSLSDAAAAAIWRAGELLRAAGLFLQWAVVSPALASRSATALASAWVTLANDLGRVLFPGASPQVLAALDSAASASSPLREALGVVEQEWKDWVDPVWQVMLGSGNETLNAELISGDGVQLQVADRLADPSRNRPLTIVVSPAPVFDHPLVFFFVRAAIAWESENRLAAEDWENEPWGGNTRALHRLLGALSELESVVILSGDVHYACSSVSDYSTPANKDVRFVQLTSSSAKNSWEPSTALARADKVGSWDLTDLIYLSGNVMFEKLPTLEQWDDAGETFAGLLPTRENAWNALQAVATLAREELEELGDGAGDAWKRVTNPPDLAGAFKAIRRSLWNAADSLKLKYYHVLEAVLGPVHWYEFLHSYPLASQEILLLLEGLGIDPAQLPRARTTMLQDLRGDARIGDSSGLDDAIKKRAQFRRHDILHGEARTVGMPNIGLVRFDSMDGVGDVVIHDLYGFPVPDLEKIRGAGPPPAKTSFRDDWIIARHAAGLTFGGPVDVGVWTVP